MGAEERAGDRVEEAFGRVQRVTGLVDGKVLADPFEGRVLLRRFSNPAGKGRAVPAGVGPLAPVASNATDAGRQLNRRVEIVAR